MVRKSPTQLQREIDEALAEPSHATKLRSVWPPVVGKHGLGTADVRTNEGTYWIITVPTGYRVDYKPWGPSREVDLGTFSSRRSARTKISEHAASVGALIRSSGRRSHAAKKSPATEQVAIDVAFRIFPEGDVIALFPKQAERSGQILSYQHLGQHGGADRSLLRLKKATPSQYAPLLAELKSIGYVPRLLK